MDDEDFLAAVEADNVGTPVAQEPETEPTPQEPKAQEPEVLELTDPVTPPAPQEPAPEPMRSDDAADGRLAALLDERDRRKAAEAELQRLREAQQQQPPAQAPDAYEDPEGFAAYQQAERQREMYYMRLQFSERVARIEHGAETVEAAKAWAAQKAEQDPLFNAKALQSDDPIGLAITEYQREEITSKVTMDEFAQFQAWKAAQGQLQQGGTPPVPNKTSAIPPRSLASAPSAGNMLTEPVQSDDEIFDEVIGKR